MDVDGSRPRRASLVAGKAPRALLIAGPALLAAALAGLSAVIGWHGTDLAAQTYRVNELRAHGLILWDLGWYGGNYPLSYSVLLPLLGAGIGLVATGVVFAAGAAWFFDRIVIASWGRRPWGSWYFAVSTLILVAIGQLPYLSGEAFGLAAVFALLRGRRRVGAVLVVLCTLCSGVAAAFLVLALVAWAWHDRRQRWWLFGLAAVPVALLGAIDLAFPGTGSFPYAVGGALLSLLLCVVALTPPVRRFPVVRTGALLYAVLIVGALLVPTPMGGNANRLAEGVGTALLVCLADDWLRSVVAARIAAARGAMAVTAAVGATVVFAIWQWAPAPAVGASPSTRAAFYQPLVTQLDQRTDGPVRVEVPPTDEHWESVYVAPHMPLARGWERQLDIANNSLFYDTGALTPASYQAWLDRNGVSFVALPHTALDYAAKQEAALLQSGRVGDLRLVWQSSNWTLWRVMGSPGLLSGPGQIERVQGNDVVIHATDPGSLTLRVRYTPYWSSSGAPACVRQAPGGWTQIDARTPGRIELTTSLFTHSSC